MYIELTEVTAHLEHILGVIEEAEYSLFATDGTELEEHKVKLDTYFQLLFLVLTMHLTFHHLLSVH